jgi:UDP:flavonoid glycosyltransferase YjiC (YdhE family)
LRARNIDIVTRPLDFPALLQGADWVITTGGVGTTAGALLAGVPVVLIPQVIEQHLLGLKLRETGAGLLLDFDRTQSSVAAIVPQLRKGSPFSVAAAGLRDKYASHQASAAVARVVAGIERLFGGSGA